LREAIIRRLRTIAMNQARNLMNLKMKCPQFSFRFRNNKLGESQNFVGFIQKEKENISKVSSPFRAIFMVCSDENKSENHVR